MTADRPATEPHPWENHDDSCQCHITICADCGCTNEIVPAEAAQGAAPHHNHDGCNPYDEAHVAGKSGAAPRAEGLDWRESQIRAWHDSSEPARSLAERIAARLLPHNREADHE